MIELSISLCAGCIYIYMFFLMYEPDIYINMPVMYACIYMQIKVDDMIGIECV